MSRTIETGHFVVRLEPPQAGFTPMLEAVGRTAAGRLPQGPAQASVPCTAAGSSRRASAQLGQAFLEGGSGLGRREELAPQQEVQRHEGRVHRHLVGGRGGAGVVD